MKSKLSFIQVITTRDRTIEVTFHTRGDYRVGRRHYKSPTANSLYRLLNNSMISDIVPSCEPYGLLLEITPRY